MWGQAFWADRFWHRTFWAHETVTPPPVVTVTPGGGPDSHPYRHLQWYRKPMTAAELDQRQTEQDWWRVMLDDEETIAITDA